MPGMTATGLPLAGITVNHGRVGLCQNGVWKPVKYRTSGSVQTRMAAMSRSAIMFWQRCVRSANSLSGKPLVGVTVPFHQLASCLCAGAAS